MPSVEELEEAYGTGGMTAVDQLVKKPRAKPGTATYGKRDPDKRRAYFREYMRKRRAVVKASKLSEPSLP